MIWVIQTSLLITSQYLMPIKIGSYEDHIFCDVLLMDITYILFDKHYYLNILHYDQENIYVFKHNEIIINLFLVNTTKKKTPNKLKYIFIFIHFFGYQRKIHN